MALLRRPPRTPADALTMPTALRSRWFGIGLVGILSAPPTASPRVRPANGRRRARATLLAALGSVILAFVGFVMLMDHGVPQVRDPEYGRRERRWQARTAAEPQRPVVMVLGSSRVSMGVRPAAWDDVRPAGDTVPMLVNLSLVGSGPLMEMMVLQRVLANGPAPDAVLLEYWPPFLRGDGAFAEENRIDPLRLGPNDRDFVRHYFRDPDATFQTMRQARRNPFLEYRHRIMAQINPRWLKWHQRLDVAWDNLDGGGWLPGVKQDPAGSPNRTLRLEQCRPHYDKQFDGFTVSPMADRAFRDLIALCRERGIAVGLLYMPESPEFQAWYPAHVEREAQAHLRHLAAETNVPLIDTRDWMPPDATCDGFHLFREMATPFTQKLGPAVMAAFPNLKRAGGS